MSLIAFASSTLHADLGTSYTVFAYFYMKDGSHFEACFDVHSWILENQRIYLDNNIKLTNEQCMFAFKSSYTALNNLRSPAKSETGDSILVLRKLDDFKLKSLHKKNDYPNHDYIGLVFLKDLIYINVDAVKYVKYKRHHQYKHRGGIYLASTTMKDSLKNMRYWNFVEYKLDHFPIFGEQEELGTYHIFFNYNANYNKAELDRLVMLKYDPMNNPQIKKILSKYPKKAYQELPYKAKEQFDLFWSKQIKKANQWFWQNGVFIIDYLIGC